MQSSIIKKTRMPLTFVLCTLLFNSCKKDEICDHPSLPCQTHEGKNTFGCLIDGVPFVAETSFSIGGAVPVSGSFDESTGLLIIEGAREDAQEHIDVVRFLVYVPSGASEYFVHVVNEYDGYVDYSGENCTFQHDPNNEGTVSISFLDKDKNIIAGTFEMILNNSDCSPATMTITSGRFDFGY